MDYLTLRQDNIEIKYVAGEKLLAKETFVFLQEALVFLSRYFGLKKPFSLIRVALAPSRSQYDQLVANFLGVKAKIPSVPQRIAQTQETKMVFLSPTAYKDDSSYKFKPDEYRRLVFHELVHVFEEYLSADMEAVPCWWGEGLAVYLSGQGKYEDEFRQPVLRGIRERNIPTFQSIQASRKQSYRWGGTIVAFIEKTYGKKMILKIAKKGNNKNILKIINEDLKDFEKKWKNMLYSKQ